MNNISIKLVNLFYKDGGWVFDVIPNLSVEKFIGTDYVQIDICFTWLFWGITLEYMKEYE